MRYVYAFNELLHDRDQVVWILLGAMVAGLLGALFLRWLDRAVARAIEAERDHERSGQPGQPDQP